MKIVTKFVLLLLLGTSVFSQSPVVPIVTDGVLLGGVRDGKWLTAEQTFPNIKNETQFILISPRGTEIIGSDVGRKTDMSSCSDFPNIEIRKKSLIAIGAAAIWNPLPRLWKRIPPTDKNIQKVGVELLKSRKIVATKIELRQASEVDIDGDRTTRICRAK